MYKTVLIRGHNVCFYGAVMKIIPRLSLVRLLICRPLENIFQVHVERVTTTCNKVYMCLDECWESESLKVVCVYSNPCYHVELPLYKINSAHLY